MMTKYLIEALGDMTKRLDVLEDWLRCCIVEAGWPGPDAGEVEAVAAELNVLLLEEARGGLSTAIDNIERVIQRSKQ